MSKKPVSWLSITIVLFLLPAGIGPLKSSDVSQFLTQENGVRLTWGSPGGIAYDGTNFLSAVRSTNGEIVAMRMATNGSLPRPQLDLGRKGGLPRVAFDGANYLVVWPDSADLPSDIYGQFIQPDGVVAGSPFLIEADADASEMGGLAFDGTNYLAVWESDTGNSNTVFAVKGRIISPAGDLLGTRLEISSGATGQRFPDVSWNGENYLVTWTSQSEDTNSWNIRGCRLSREGALLGSMVISEHAAQQPWPPTLASDGTNWLAAWTRESGPYFVLNSNAWLPLLYGRIVARDGTPSGHEVEIRRSALGQFKPRAAFNGQNYLVGWVERVRFDESGPPPYVTWSWQAQARELNSSGQPVMSEFFVRRLSTVAQMDPPALAMGQGAGLFLVAWEELWYQSVIATTFVRLYRPSALRNISAMQGGGVQFDLIGPNTFCYGVEMTSNFVNWIPVLKGSMNVHVPGRITVSGAVGNGFFRAYDAQTVCRENLHLIQQAKAHWALDHDKAWEGSPADSDLFGSGAYLPSKPVCPTGGQYSYLYVGMLTQCSLGPAAGHTY